VEVKQCAEEVVLTEQVVAEPAHEFYITWQSAKTILSRIRKTRRVHNHHIRK
jgi:hypothetical protein